MVLAGTSVAILVTMLLTLIRAALGPTPYDRILAVNVFGTATVLIIAAFGFLTGRPAFLDVALVYALINFIGTIAVLRFMERRSDALSAADEKVDDRVDDREAPR